METTLINALIFSFRIGKYIFSLYNNVRVSACLYIFIIFNFISRANIPNRTKFTQRVLSSMGFNLLKREFILILGVIIKETKNMGSRKEIKL